MPILNEHSFEFISRSPEQTRRLGMRLGALLKAGDRVYLSGDLGSGKTTLVQGIASGWGSADAVTSPTFVLVNLYRRPDGQRLYHLDAYRLTSLQEALELDLDTLLAGNPLVVEWAEKIQTVLPEHGLWVHLRHVDNIQRDLVVSGRGPHYEKLLANLRTQLYGVR